MEELLDLELESRKSSEDRWERQKRISWWEQELIQNANILVVGAGTLGNEVCKNLALLGVCNVTVIDYDIIEEVNLSRSVLMRSEDKGKNKAEVVAKRMKELYGDMTVTALNLDVVFEYGSANYKDFDVVLMTVDNLEARMYINRYCYMWNTPLIDGGLNGLICTVQVIIPPKTACYECTFSKQDYMTIKNRYSCDGLRRDAPEGKIAMVITSAAIGAGIMTQEAVKILHGAEPTLAGKKAVIDGNTNEFEVLSVSKRENCLGHYEIEPEEVIYLDYSNKFTLRELKESIRNVIDDDGDDFQIEHDRSIIYGGECPSCGAKKEVLGLAGKTNENEMVCDNCGEILNPDISGFLRLDDRTLAEHGVPDNHVLTLYLNDGGVRYVVPKNRGRR
ncbi:MAG: ThiF family adenylyltransferase [Methanophagales archaeon]|nr:ThiF family adenylyltransferase [Methanophagales archaeon]